jgi:hypothetical protein
VEGQARPDAEVGEVLSTAARITPGDFGSWTAQWLATARRVHGIAGQRRDRGHAASPMPGPASGRPWLPGLTQRLRM